MWADCPAGRRAFGFSGRSAWESRAWEAQDSLRTPQDSTARRREFAALSLAVPIAVGRRSLTRRRSDGNSAAVSTAAPKKRGVLRWTGLDEEIFEVWAPAVANLILLPLVGSIDLFWIGQSRDPLAIAGMGAANQVYSTIYFLISFLPAVITPRIAEEIARERRDKAAQWVSEALGFACLMGFFGMLVLVLCPHTVLRLITNSPQVLAEAVPYCRIRGVSLIATLCSSVSFATFRGLLDFRTPLRVSLSANLLNALLNPLLMFTLGLGVSGVAAATTIAEIYSAVTFVLLLRSRKMLSRKPAIPAAETVRSLLQTGLAVQVRSVSTNLMFLLAVRRVTAIDPSGVQAAAYQVTQQFWNLAGYVSLALSSSGAGLVPTKYWKKGGGINEARQLADRLYLWGCGLGLVLSLLQLLALPLVSLMAPIKEVQQAARTPAILAAFLQLLNGAVFAGEGMLLGLRAFPVLAASSLFGCGLMVTSLYLAGDRALIGLWVGLFLFNISRLTTSLSHRFFFGPLARSKVKAVQP